MRVVFAPDSFKGTLDAADAAAAMAAGWRNARPEDSLDLAPMADGGEGTVRAMVEAAGGTWAEADVTGPLGAAVRARYGLLDGGRTAVIEMAEASGLVLVPESERDPRAATTRGTGELMRDALARGCRRLIIGIGGSATNDGGAGVAQALGYRLLDAAGQELAPGCAPLARLDRIDASGALPTLCGCVVSAACDVDNPLCGPRGASAVYGPQKGATPEMVPMLDAALAHFATIIERDLGIHVLDLPGGGIAAGLAAFAGAELVPGAPLVAGAIRLTERMQGAEWVVTGEGRLDHQTASGKTPAIVARLARAAGARVLAIAGSATDGRHEGYDAVISLSDEHGAARAMAEPAACLQESLAAWVVSGGLGGS
ncbi:MAG: glycerate kinase [Candidatus Hydrogenedens sp.]|nr:glycerate kinase [Candidatus Hydrogenedens sp.]